MKNKKCVTIKSGIIFIMVVIAIIVLVQVAYSLFVDKEEGSTETKISKIGVKLEEDPEWEENIDEYGIEKYTKIVKGVSTEQTDTYVRIRCVPIVQYYKENVESGSGEWVTNATPQEDILITLDGNDWVQEGDYWYYTKILKGNTQTSNLNIKWSVLELPSELSDKNIRTDVRVVLEYAQASNNVWKDVFKIEQLPEQVEQ